MNIYIVAKETKNRTNQFIPELINALRRNDCAVDCGLETLWGDRVFFYDIVYFQWPEYSFLKTRINDCLPTLLRERIGQLKDSGIIVVAHCHNLRPHVNNDRLMSSIYDIIYGMADLIIHMGVYSKELCSQIYPEAKHVIVPHHIYSSLSFAYEQESSCNDLNIPPNKTNVLCFGAFRTKEERRLIIALRKELRNTEYNFVTPGFYQESVLQRNPLKMLSALVNIAFFRLMGIRFSHGFINDVDMQKYFCASDIVMIQRPKILNSGNLPMGFAAGKVVIGPNVGNVGCILSETKNPTFDPNNILSISSALSDAKRLEASGKGAENKEFARRNWDSDIVAQSIINSINQIKQESDE